MPFFTTTDGLRLYYEEHGEGQPLLCLAGLTRNCRDFDHLLPHVTDVRVVAMDYRGRGRSEYDADYLNYNLLREGADALELLDHLEIGRATLLGTSRGGLIAMVCAAYHSDRLAGVILNDVGPDIDPTGLSRLMEYVGRTPPHRSLDDMAAAMKQAFEAQFPGVPLKMWRHLAGAQYCEEDGALKLRYDPKLRDAVIEIAANAEGVDLWTYFDALEAMPAGLIRGANSDILNRDTADQMQSWHTGMITAEVPDRGHVPFLNEPESVDIIHRILKATA